MSQDISPREKVLALILNGSMGRRPGVRLAVTGYDPQYAQDIPDAQYIESVNAIEKDNEILLNGYNFQALASNNTYTFIDNYTRTHGRKPYTRQGVEKSILLILMLSAQGYTVNENTITLLSHGDAKNLWEIAGKMITDYRDDCSGVPAILESCLYGRNAYGFISH